MDNFVKHVSKNYDDKVFATLYEFGTVPADFHIYTRESDAEEAAGQTVDVSKLVDVSKIIDLGGDNGKY